MEYRGFTIIYDRCVGVWKVKLSWLTELVFSSEEEAIAAIDANAGRYRVWQLLGH